MAVEIPEWLSEAIEKYKAKLDFTILEHKLREKQKQIINNAIPTQIEIHDLQIKISQLLSAKGVLSDWNLIYCSAGLELLRIKKRFHPSVWKWIVDYKRELMIFAQKWVKRGLDKDILREIAKIVGANELNEYL